MPPGGRKNQRSVNTATPPEPDLARNLQYLARASQTLASSLDYQTTLHKVAELAIPHIADWCVVDLLDEQGELQLVAVAHQDPQQVKWARQFRQSQPVDMSSQQGLADVLRTKKPKLYPLITEPMMKAWARDRKQLQLMRRLGFKSVIIVPIIAEKTPIGGITLVSTHADHHYNEADLTMAQALASRAALAITNARLYQQAQEAIKIRDDFISIASHELKTPLTSIRMYTEALQRRLPATTDAKTVEYLDVLKQQVGKMSQLIKDLLDVSRLQGKSVPLKIHRFDLAKLIQEVIATIQDLAHDHHIQFTATAPIWLWADRERLSQVLINLINNAIKYSPGGKRVVIRVQADRTTRMIKVIVRDYGIGIAKEHQPHVFNRFFQVKDESQGTYAGLGMGLYIAHRIAQQHQGTLTVSSTPGKGSTFTLHLPVKPTAHKSR